VAENMVRCARCHEVFDAELGPCPKCGTPYKAPVAAAPLFEGLYTDRYAAAAPEPVVPAAPVVPGGRDRTTYFMWGGVGLISAAVVLVLLFSLGLTGGIGATPGPRHAVLPAALPTPTLPPTVDATLSQLNDIGFSAHVTIDGRIVMTAESGSKAQTIVVHYDGIVSGGNQWGILKVGSKPQEIMVVNGDAYVRTPPTGKWSGVTTVPSYKIICPLFGLKDGDYLAMVGQETVNGRVLNHMRSTHWWSPELSRLALYDLSGLRLTPDIQSLDIWSAADGTPVSATYDGTNMAGNTTLFGLHVQYQFSDVGVAQTIVRQSPSASPAHE
jgi:hypothetical protein